MAKLISAKMVSSNPDKYSCHCGYCGKRKILGPMAKQLFLARHFRKCMKK
jgi:hypothetical protein